MFSTTDEDSRESENEDSTPRRRPLDSDVSDAKSMRSYLEKEIYGSHLEDDKRQQELERKLKSDLCGFLHPDTAQTAWCTSLRASRRPILFRHTLPATAHTVAVAHHASCRPPGAGEIGQMVVLG